MPRLSVCLIVRNEERHLARCLGSVRGLADEVVVVDTGSTDGTVAIARDHGAKVEHFTWVDDFSAARNAALAHASGDWILSLDADESIAARDHDVIRALVARDDVDAVLVAQRHYMPPGTVTVGWQSGSGGYGEGAPYAGFFDVDCRRLFRRRPWLRFRNRVHEELRSTDPARPLVETRGDWVIHHFGKLDDRAVLRAKADAYLRIGRLKVSEHPGDPQAHYELGIQLAESGQHADALACYQQALALTPDYRDTWLRVAISHATLSDHEPALAALGRAAATLPQHLDEIAVLEGDIHRRRGDVEACESAYRRALDASPAHRSAVRPLARLLIAQRRFREARDVLGPPAGDDGERLALDGSIALGLGELEAAARHLRASLAIAPGLDAALNLSTVLEVQGDHAGARAAAAEAMRISPGSPDALNQFSRISLSRAYDASPRPSRLTIFFYQPHSIPFDGTTPRARGLGGTESAIVYLAEALTARGQRCVVFNNCEQPGHTGGVEYARWETLPVRSVAEEPHVVVGVRHWELLGRARLAPLQILWTGDAFDQPFLDGLAEAPRRAGIDLFMLQSAWQAQTFHERHQIPRSRIVRTALGAAASAGEGPPDATTRPRARRLVYASTPFRGLDVLLQVFPRIRAACPDAELDVFSSMQVYGVSGADDRAQFGAIYERARQPGVTLHGSVPQPELARYLLDARVLAYPNHYAETFCIAAAEAQAAGCAVVTSALGALPETVGDAGICIEGDPASEGYQQRFVDACVELLHDDARWSGFSARARAQAAERFSWPAIAAHWEAVCRAALTPEPPEVQRLAVHLQAGRTGLALRMLARTPRPATVPPRAWAALGALVAWQAGEGPAPDSAGAQQLAVHFASLRNAAV